MSRPIQTPTSPETTKKSAVAPDTELTEKPRSSVSVRR
jgi:hypothetical protein